MLSSDDPVVGPDREQNQNKTFNPSSKNYKPSIKATPHVCIWSTTGEAEYKNKIKTADLTGLLSFIDERFLLVFKENNSPGFISGMVVGSNPPDVTVGGGHHPVLVYEGPSAEVEAGGLLQRQKQGSGSEGQQEDDSLCLCRLTCRDTCQGQE